MMKVKHTAQSAAKAVRTIFAQNIPKTWEEYFAPGFKVSSYNAAKLVQEQCNGIDRAIGRVADGPVSFREAADALAVEIPELYAEYWEALKV